LGIRPPELSRPVANLSGGNQQKVSLGKWLIRKPRVLLLDEPTRGVDVGAKADIHRAIRAAANEGAAVLIISSDLPELLRLSDRIVVMRDGRVAGEVEGAMATEESVMKLATGQGV
jgi:ABC-type sugar transport system ATPase subunit